MSKDSACIFTGNPGPPAAYYEQIQSIGLGHIALTEAARDVLSVVSTKAPDSNLSRLSSPLSNLSRSPSLRGISEERGDCSADEQSDMGETNVSTLLENDLLPYLNTDFNSFVPPALYSYRPAVADGDASTNQTLIAISDLPSSGTPPSVRRKNTARFSRFFPRVPIEKMSCIPFPALNATSFGLVQERLCHEPFRLLVAVMFLNKTRGKVALPVCYDLFARYPSAEDLANANFEELSGMIHELGLQNQRAERMIKLAQTWVLKPPTKGQRYRMLHYPGKEDGKDIPKGGEAIDDEDPRTAWEIAHLPGTGAYAMDSWRIFCRDELRGLPTGLQEDLDPESIVIEMQQEWTRVLPLDKELRAYLRWRWLRLGWTWDPVTGERTKLDKEACKEVENGGISIEGDITWAVEGMVTALDYPRSNLLVEELDVEESTCSVAQRDIELHTVEQLGDMSIVETQPELPMNQEVAELQNMETQWTRGNRESTSRSQGARKR
ncbi:hypothetical protein MMC34_007415 [Xylographa carneopallida]|nr:hypothetical protein [Xylographa carneopallida]